ncbi:hypothetical protein K9L16_02710 [Candidatus Pacearchaeota archaeon]|nr:hypothetical protein [Candidatus Pacearchaeota archaeon]
MKLKDKLLEGAIALEVGLGCPMSAIAETTQEVANNSEEKFNYAPAAIMLAGIGLYGSSKNLEGLPRHLLEISGILATLSGLYYAF